MKTAWKHIRRTPYKALAAIFTMVQTFFIITVLAVLAYGASATLSYFETRPLIIAFLKNEATAEEISALQTKLQLDSRIKSLEYVSREEALELFKKSAENPLVSELLPPTAFPADLEFSVTDLVFAEDVIRELRENEAVESVGYSLILGSAGDLQEAISRLQTITNYIRIGGAVILGFLLASSFFVLLLVISTRIAARREEITILQLIGATPGFVRNPFLLEGIFYTTVGVFIGWIFAFLIVLYISPSLVSYFQEVPFLPPDLLSMVYLFGAILGAELVIAILLGLLGSFAAIKRYLRA